jgi:flagellar basal-body rod modification protein FlgD
MSPTNTVAPSSSTTPAASATPATDPLASESTFLTLLVSQLQNQDPLNPVDSTQFVQQLTSYSQLEQLINIDKNTVPVTPAATAPAAT